MLRMIDALSGTAWIAAALTVSGAMYLGGVVPLWRATATGRGIRIVEALAFAFGWSALGCALLGPVHRWAEDSFAAHMLQHELLMLVAAPLLVVGRPLAAWTWALPRAARSPARRALACAPVAWAWRRFTQPLTATIAQLAMLFVWHVPRLFDYAATHAGVHALQHASFLAAALCFWWSVRDRFARRAGATDAAAAVAVVCLFVTMLASGALGALLTFAPTPWYRIHADALWGFGASALEDQQLGGLLMWIPGGTVYFVVGLLRARRLLMRGAPASAFDVARGIAP